MEGFFLSYQAKATATAILAKWQRVSWMGVKVGNKTFNRRVRCSTFGGRFASQTNVSFSFEHRSTSVKVSALLPRGTFTEGLSGKNTFDAMTRSQRIFQATLNTLSVQPTEGGKAGRKNQLNNEGCLVMKSFTTSSSTFCLQ